MNHSARLFDEAADFYTEKYFDVSLYSKTLDLLISKLNVSAKICDLACGPANVSYYLKQSLIDLKVSGVDLSPRMIEIASKKIIDGNFYKGDIVNFQHSIPSKQSFDLILCGFGLPYLSKEETSSMLLNIKNNLQKQGLLYLSFMKGEDQIEKTFSSQDQNKFLFTNFHHPDTILNLAKEKGFELIHMNQHEAPSKDVEMIFILSH